MFDDPTETAPSAVDEPSTPDPSEPATDMTSFAETPAPGATASTDGDGEPADPAVTLVPDNESLAEPRVGLVDDSGAGEMELDTAAHSEPANTESSTGQDNDDSVQQPDVPSDSSSERPENESAEGADAEPPVSATEGEDATGSPSATAEDVAAVTTPLPASKQGSSRRPKLPDIDYTDVEDNRLIREVFAAPHRIYLLNKVRKAIASAGESDLGVQLRMVEADILHQVAERRAAKESLCERAEAIKDSTSWKATGDAYKALFDEWKTVGAAGRELDDELWARFNAARGAFNDRRAKHFEEREQVWSANREKKEELCAEAEALADSTEWKATADKIRDLQARWKSAGSAGRERDDALWARFNSAKQRFFDRRAEVWAENRKRKESLVLDAEALKDSSDWRTAGEAMKAMQAEWKTIGPAGREAEDELWSRFRAATQAFFDRRSSTFAERNQSERENLAKKQELIARAEALVYAGDAIAASREAKELQAQWKETGPVPREHAEAIWARFRGACDRIFENAHGERDRQQNEWHLRMREALIRKREQLNSLRESIAHDESNIERWRVSLSTLQPGGKSEEIGKSLEDKIIDVMERIRDKQARAEDLRTSITDIEAKLRE